jgi:hypothetical protein
MQRQLRRLALDCLGSGQDSNSVKAQELLLSVVDGLMYLVTLEIPP